MVELGSKNSRMRDFFDIQALAAAESFEGAVLSRAISETFGRRRTAVPGDTPLGLTREFTETDGKAAQWAGFVRRLPGTTVSTDFAAVIAAVAAFADPVLTVTARKEPFAKNWTPGGPWR
jgi:nucleotidyltransferase AbiEii toxin of type IV toxin-antitoxin system